jgi:hypothetical protein
MNETTAPTPGPWNWTAFCKENGEPIKTVQDVADTIAGSAHWSDRAELFGVTLDRDGDEGKTVVCYTGNGPNAHHNSRVIALVPQMIAFLRDVLKRDQGFVYSRDERSAKALIDYIDHGYVGEAQDATGSNA